MNGPLLNKLTDGSVVGKTIAGLRSIALLFAFACCLVCLSACATSPAVTPQQAESRGDFARAYLLHARACGECSASHPGEGHGECCGPPYSMWRFLDRLVHTDDGALLTILHSPSVPRQDKLDILRYLNETIEKEYAGIP